MTPEPLFWGLTEPVLWFSVLTFFIGVFMAHILMRLR